MKYFFLLFLIASTIASALHAQDDTPTIDLAINLEDIVTVNLDENGFASVVMSVPRTGTLRPSFFGDSVAQNIEINVASLDPVVDTEPNPKILMHNRVLDPGDYRMSVTGFPNSQLQLRLSLEPALDIYEPNDTLETAAEVSVPFFGLIDIIGSSDDWFKVEVPKNKIVGAQLHAGEAYGKYFIGFYDENGTQLYLSDDTDWGTDGMRYFKSDGGPLYIKVYENTGVTFFDPQTFILFEIQSFSPNMDNPNTFVKIAMGGNDRASSQIDFVSEAAGTNVANAEESIDITEELTRAVSRQNDTEQGWVLWGVFGAIIIAAIGVFLVLFRKRKVSE